MTSPPNTPCQSFSLRPYDCRVWVAEDQSSDARRRQMEKMVKGCARRLFETPKQMDQMESRWSAHRGVGFARGPPSAVFMAFFVCVCDRNCGRALKIAHTTTSKQGNPALALAQGGTGARITAQSEEGRGGGCSQGSSELDSERRRVQCALQGKAMDRHVSSSSGSSWLAASSIMPLSFLSRSYHRADL